MKNIKYKLLILLTLLFIVGCSSKSTFLLEYKKIPINEKITITSDEKKVYFSLPYTEYLHVLHRRLTEEGWEIFQVPEAVNFDGMQISPNTKERANFYVRLDNPLRASFVNLKTGKVVAYLDLYFVSEKTGDLYQYGDSWSYAAGLYLHNKAGVDSRNYRNGDAEKMNRAREEFTNNYVDVFIEELNNNLIIKPNDK